MLHTALMSFFPAIQTLPTNRPLTKQDLLREEFLVDKEESMEIYYAPHNEYINLEAKVMIVGITPGWKQMKTAYEQFLKSMVSGEDLETCLKETKQAAGFAGSMRTNLVHMLDQCDLPRILGISKSSDLFGKSRSLLHTTSIIKHPVFIKGKNYTGHQPTINRSSLLQHYAYREFPNELAQMATPALVIPLGKTVEQVILRLLEEQKQLDHTYLFGFPHPSGANGHRIHQFQQQQSQLREKVMRWGQGK
ncbi:uracil-DNA glycosylase family protein [Niallia sp. Krafla_26]|uniref:uracil-DNA glycosylase family protein n=1 Tax=Niallia sp. Krafla_26 TaxID=3064703 RepID=UPI003D162544